MIGGVSGAAAGGGSAMDAIGALGGDAFLKLLVAQLRFQNPLSPSDPGAMLQQTAAFTQVETLKQVATAQQTLLGLNQAGIAAGLVGKEVSAVAADGSQITGAVDGVRFTEEGPVLLLGDTEVPLDAVTAVRGAAASAEPVPSDAPASGTTSPQEV